MTFLIEIRQALGSLLRARGFALGALLCLSLGLAATLAVLSQVDQLVLRPLPYPRAHRLYEVLTVDLRTKSDGPLSIGEVTSLQQGTAGSLETFFCTSRTRTLLGLEEPLQVKVGLVSWNFFSALGVQPAAGRLAFSQEEGAADPGGVAVLSHGFWRKHFAGNPQAIGQRVRLNGHGTEIVGVLPADFRYPIRVNDCDVFLPEAVPFARHYSPGMQTYRMAARLRDQVPLSQAQNQLAATADALTAERRSAMRASLRPLGDRLTGQTSRVLYPLLGAVGLLLAIAVFNVASLQLARNLAKEREFAVRSALGATRAQLFRHFLTESLVVATAAAILGILLSLVLQRGLQAIAPIRIQVQLNGFLLLASAALTLLTGLALALTSAVIQQRRLSHQSLREGSGSSASRRHRKALKVLVACELALSVAILLGTGRLVRTLVNLQRVDPGFQSAHLLTSVIPLPPAKYGTQEAQNAFLDALQTRLKAIPGVQEVGVNDTMTFIHAVNGTMAAATPAPDAPQAHALYHVVTAEYFTALSIPLLEGRTFTHGEKDACVISRRLARQLWPTTSAVGRVLYGGADRPLTVVGVAGDILESDLTDTGDPQLYVNAKAFGLFEGATAALLVKGDPKAYRAQVKRAIREVDPALAIPEVRTMREAIMDSDGFAIPRTAGLMFAGFGGVALALTGFGLYSVLSQSVVRRTREFGIRSALGAGPRNLAHEVVKEAGLLLAVGVAGGVALGWALGKPLDALLYKAQHLDPALLASVVLILSLVAFLAFLIPAWRAALLAPSEALRAE